MQFDDILIHFNLLHLMYEEAYLDNDVYRPSEARDTNTPVEITLVHMVHTVFYVLQAWIIRLFALLSGTKVIVSRLVGKNL